MTPRRRQISSFNFAAGNQITYNGQTITQPYEAGAAQDPNLLAETVDRYDELKAKHGYPREKAAAFLGVNDKAIARWRKDITVRVKPMTFVDMADCRGVWIKDLVRNVDNLRLAEHWDRVLHRRLGWQPDLGRNQRFVELFPNAGLTPVRTYGEYLGIRTRIAVASLHLHLMQVEFGDGIDAKMLARAETANKEMYQLTLDHDFERARHKHHWFHYETTADSLRKQATEALLHTIVNLGQQGWASDEAMLSQVETTYDRHAKFLDLLSEMHDHRSRAEAEEHIQSRYASLIVYHR